MISVKVLVSAIGDILGFEVFGHSGYAPSGSDIVCAGVSSAMCLVVNTLTDVLTLSLEELEINDEKAYFKFRISQKDFSICKYMMIGLKNHFLYLEEEYSDNIKVNYVEV